MLAGTVCQYRAFQVSQCICACVHHVFSFAAVSVFQGLGVSFCAYPMVTTGWEVFIPCIIIVCIFRNHFLEWWEGGWLVCVHFASTFSKN